MEKLILEGTENTPAVQFDPQGGLFEISGRSLPDDAQKFFGPVLSWLKEYAGKPNVSTELIIKLEYINTASSKMLLDVFFALQKIEGARIAWCFLEDDEDMEETGEEFAELVDLPFELRAY